MTFAPYCRKLAETEEVRIKSFRGMKALYKDFTNIEEHDGERALTFIKRYRCNGKYFKYGTPKKEKDILIHARGIKRKDSINYREWDKVVKELKEEVKSVGTIGTVDDQRLDCDDYRGIELQDLMNLIAGAKVVVGVSSGVMHLAQACGTPVVVWADDKTRFGETMEKRYKETWNPFKTEVRFITELFPKPERIINEIRSIM